MMKKYISLFLLCVSGTILGVDVPIPQAGPTIKENPFLKKLQTFFGLEPKVIIQATAKQNKKILVAGILLDRISQGDFTKHEQRWIFRNPKIFLQRFWSNRDLDRTFSPIMLENYIKPKVEKVQVVADEIKLVISFDEDGERKRIIKTFTSDGILKEEK